MKKQSKGAKVFLLITNTLILLFGNALYAAAVELFIVPSGLVTGGVTGISIMLTKLSVPFNVSYMVFAINIILYIIGACFLGRRFMVTTGASTVLYPLFLNIMERICGKYDPKVFLGIHDDLVLCAAAAGILIGTAVGVLVRIGASTGGSDIPPLIVAKYTSVPVGTGMFILDGAIILSQLIVADIRHALYGVIMVIVYSYVINQISVMGSGKVQISVLTEKKEEVRTAVLTTVGRGITFLSATKGYTGEKTDMVMSVVSNRQLARAKRIILDVDPSAFMIITRVSEVNGNGFSFSKGDKKLDKTDLM